MTSKVAKKASVKVNPVARLVHSLESRIKTYQKNKARLTSEYKEKVAKEDQKINDARLQLNALKK